MKLDILVKDFNIDKAKEYALVLDGLFKTAFKMLKQKSRILSVNVIFLTEEEMKSLNKEKRQIDEITDVLSFPMLNLRPGDKISKKKFKIDYNKQEKSIFLGDIFICYNRAKTQAEEYRHSLLREISYLAVHGLLHLLGFDHIHETDKKLMRATEELVLNKNKIKS